MEIVNFTPKLRSVWTTGANLATLCPLGNKFVFSKLRGLPVKLSFPPR